MSKLLFLCTGNYYRSRFAELLFNAMAATHALPWQAFSRGLAIDKGVNNVGPMSPLAIDALRALGCAIDLQVCFWKAKRPVRVPSHFLRSSAQKALTLL
jgi:protein-tyrosine-phosphatase